MTKYSYIFFFLLLSASTLSAQKLEIKKIEIAGEKIIVHFDLDDNNPNNEYQISLFSSQNNFAKALASVSGDVGAEIKSGVDRKIIWNVKEELGAFNGKLSLEVRGKVFVPVAKINNLTAGSKFKRGKSHTFTWKPGNSNPVNIDLLKDGQRITGELNQPNNGKFSLFIPEQSSIGKDYTLRITNTRNLEDVVVSQPFSVTRKIPLLLKAIPIIVVGGVVAALAGKGGGGGGNETPVTPDIPGPPVPSGN
jgi:hypothetical protein